MFSTGPLGFFGEVNALQPRIELRFSDTTATAWVPAKAVVDTGFAGALFLNEVTAHTLWQHKLNLKFIGHVNVGPITGSNVRLPLFVVSVLWGASIEDALAIVEFGSNALDASGDPRILIGSELLDGMRLVIDYNNKSTELTP